MFDVFFFSLIWSPLRESETKLFPAERWSVPPSLEAWNLLMKVSLATLTAGLRPGRSFPSAQSSRLMEAISVGFPHLLAGANPPPTPHPLLQGLVTAQGSNVQPARALQLAER